MPEEVLTEEEVATTVINSKITLTAATDDHLLVADEYREKLVISNPTGGHDAWVCNGTAAAVAGEGIYLPVGGTYVERDWSGDVHIISTTGTVIGVALFRKAAPSETPFVPGPPSTAGDAPGWNAVPSVIPHTGV